MTRNFDDGRWSNEIYHDESELEMEEKRAIEILSLTHPDDFGREDLARDEADSEELMCFLVNAVLATRQAPFTMRQIAPFADLVTYADFLMDAAHLQARVMKPSMPALIIASLAASCYTDAASESGDREENFAAAWAEVQQEAKALFEASLGGEGH